MYCPKLWFPREAGKILSIYILSPLVALKKKKKKSLQLLPLWIDTLYLPQSNMFHVLAADTSTVP